MISLEKIIAAVECSNEYLPGDGCKYCPYGYEYLDDRGDNSFWSCDTDRILNDAIALLKAQEPRLVTKADFDNADPYGYIPAWCEEKIGGECYCECILIGALKEKDLRYWTHNPTLKQMEAVKW